MPDLEPRRTHTALPSFLILQAVALSWVLAKTINAAIQRAISRVTQQNLLRAKALRSPIPSIGDSAKSGHTVAQAYWERLAYHARIGTATGKLARLAGGQKICLCSDPRCREQSWLGQMSVLNAIGEGVWVPLFL